ncbi:MAG: glutamate racemase [Actinomycetota bacterium]
MDPRPIGVFDSGVGGLTVARALIDLLPTESIIYYGDTARGPYGPRARDEVRMYSKEITELLVAEGVKMVVVACNSASSAGIDHLRESYPDLPVIEVWEPAARAAVKTTRNRRIGVIGTQLTIDSRMYEWAIRSTHENVQTFSRACPLFVEFVERGETTGDRIMDVAREYLGPLREKDVDTLILGCTHYPLLRGVVQYVMGRGVALIESDKEVAIDVFAELTRKDMWRPRDGDPEHRFLSSGDATLFAQLGQKFLGPEIAKVEEVPWT